jgi:hypothetical protein
VRGRPAASEAFALQALFLQHVAADEAQVAGTFGDESRDVVVAHQQQVDRLRLAVAEQTIAALAEAQAGTRKQVTPWFGEPAILLGGNAEAVTGFHGLESQAAKGAQVACRAASINATQAARLRR